MPHPNDIHIGRKLREARVAQGLTQEKLAAEIGISFQQVQKYENGRNRLASGRLWEIAQILNRPITFFFDGLDGGRPAPLHPPTPRMLDMAQQIAAIGDWQARHSLYRLIDSLARACPRG